MAPPCAGQARIDKWLWAARFFKTRNLAARAAGNGQILVNGLRAKPARTIAVGDTVKIQKGALEWTILVRAVRLRRGPASEAAELYEESAESKIVRDRIVEQRRAEARIGSSARAGARPSKRDRRLIERFLDRTTSDS